MSLIPKKWQRHALFYSGAKVLSMSLNFAASFVIILGLSDEDFGQYNLLLEKILIITGILDIASRNYFLQKFSSLSESQSRQELFKFWRIIFCLILLLFILLNNNFWKFIFIIGILNSSQIPFFSKLISDGESKKIFARELIIAASKLALFLFLYFVKASYIYYLLFIVLSFTTSLILFRRENLSFGFQFLSEMRARPSFNFKDTFRSNQFLIFVSFIALTTITEKFEVFLLSKYSTNMDLGIFSKLFRLVFPFTIFSSVVTNILLPEFSKKNLTKRKMFKTFYILIGIGFIGSTILSALFPLINFIFNKPIHKWIFYLMSFLIPLYFGINILSNWLISKNKWTILIICYLPSFILKVFIYSFQIRTNYETAVLTFILGTLLTISMLYVFVKRNNYNGT